MNRKAFRILVASMYLLSLVTFTCSLLWPNQTGFAAVDAAAESLLKTTVESRPLMVVGIALGAIAIMLLQLAGVIGLLLLHAWGRYVFCIYVLCNLILLLSIPYPILQNTPTYFIGYLAVLLEGAILLAMWTEPLKHEFRGVSKEAL